MKAQGKRKPSSQKQLDCPAASTEHRLVRLQQQLAAVMVATDRIAVAAHIFVMGNPHPHSTPNRVFIQIQPKQFPGHIQDTF